MAFTASQIVRALARVGFQPLRQVGSHRHFERVLPDGTGLFVTVPMNRGDLAPGTIHAILSAARMTEEDVRRLLKG